MEAAAAGGQPASQAAVIAEGQEAGALVIPDTEDEDEGQQGLGAGGGQLPPPAEQEVERLMVPATEGEEEGGQCLGTLSEHLAPSPAAAAGSNAGASGSRRRRPAASRQQRERARGGEARGGRRALFAISPEYSGPYDFDVHMERLAGADPCEVGAQPEEERLEAPAGGRPAAARGGGRSAAGQVGVWSFLPLPSQP